MHTKHTKHRQLFDEQGYVVFPQMFDAKDMDRLIALIQNDHGQESELNRNHMRFYMNVFRRSPEVQAFIAQQRIVDALSEIAGPDLWVRWDQAVEKGPGGAEFPWHQDNAYNGILEPFFQVWIALSDMTPENGGLWVQPGSHRLGLLPHHKIHNHLVSSAVEPEKAIFCQAKRGDVIVFSSMLLHRTLPNTRPEHRWAYVVEFMTLDQYDPFVKAPYFVAAENGISAPKFVETYRGQHSLANQAKYIGPRLRKFSRETVGQVKQLIGTAQRGGT